MSKIDRLIPMTIILYLLEIISHALSKSGEKLTVALSVKFGRAVSLYSWMLFDRSDVLSCPQ